MTNLTLFDTPAKPHQWTDQATPVHLNAEPGDNHRMCGAKDVYPSMWVRWLDSHRAKRTVPVCPDCAAIAGVTP